MDVARAELAKATDRDAVVRCYFDHAKTLFQFSVLFVIRGDQAQGRFIEGLGAPSGLVNRLTVPLAQRGLLSSAAEVTRPFAVHGAVSEADTMLFGTLGRVITNGVAAPLVVRDRTVAIFLGDHPVDALVPRAREAGREPVDLAREELLLWSNAVGEALERMIRKKKAVSAPPPALAGSGELPPMPRASMPSFVFSEPSVPSPYEARIDVAPYPSDPLPSTPPPPRKRALIPVVAALLLAVGGAGAWFFYNASVAKKSATRTLPGWPKVDPALAAAQMKAPGALASIRAEVEASGRVDFARDTVGRLLSFTFVEDAAETEIGITPDGIETQRTATRRRCGAVPCAAPVGAPACSFAKVFEGAKAAGLTGDRAWITYADGPPACGPPGPQWTVASADKSEIRIDPASCRADPADTFVPPAIGINELGDPQSVSPLAWLARAKQQSGLADAVLLEMFARGLRQHGVVDVTKPDSGVEYVLADSSSTVQRRVRRVRLEGCGFTRASTVRDWKNPTTAPTPKCTFDDARVYGSPKASDAVARVRYKATPAGDDGVWIIETNTGGKNVVVEVSDTTCTAWAAGRPR
jgi:hypothetical protein